MAKDYFQGQICEKILLANKKKGTGVIPPFDLILTADYVYFIHLVIQGHLQYHNVNFKVK